MAKTKIIRATTIPLSLKVFCEGMLKELSEKYEVVAVSSPGEDLEIVKNREGVRAVEVPMERHISLFKDLKSLLELIKVFSKEKPYMVHSMTPKAGLLCMMAAWLTKVPVRVHTFTGLVWPTSKGIQRMILKMTDRITCSCATHVIPEGRGVLNDLRNGGITNKPMKVLGYGNVRGVDMEYFNPKRFDLNLNADLNADRPFTYMFVGRIVGDKGINELVEAFTQLNAKYNDTRLVLVGPYENHLDPVSELTQNRIDANPAIIVAGPKFGDDLLEEYLKADCHVLPSYREGFPNTPIEAGALGLPNIVTDINGAREIVSNLDANINANDNEDRVKICDNGIIVPPRTVEPLYKAMERMLTDEELREKIKKNARPMIASRFEKGFVRNCLYEFYDEILQP